MSVRSKWHRLSTEAVNPRSRHIDTLPAGGVVDVMIADHARVLAAVRREKRRIARAAQLTGDAILEGGRLIFVGAGTSGRLGVLEAAELPPTFGVDPDAAQGIMAGGPSAVHRAREGVEDDATEGERAIRALRPRPNDVVFGISASGITPFVRAAVARARAARSHVVGVTCDAKSPLRALADIAIVLDVGPEVIAGSTRLKAGTATKIVLNTITTTAMVRAGKTYGNLMVDVKSNSEKLRDRARRIVEAVTGLDAADAGALLDRSGWNVKAAILRHERGMSRADALSRLRVEPRLRKLLRGR